MNQQYRQGEGEYKEPTQDPQPGLALLFILFDIPSASAIFASRYGAQGDLACLFAFDLLLFSCDVFASTVITFHDCASLKTIKNG